MTLTGTPRPLGPDIVAELLGAAACCRELASLAARTSRLSVSTHDLSLEAVSALQRQDQGSSQDIIVDSLAAYLKALLGRNRKCELGVLLESGGLEAAARASWNQAPRPENLTFDEAVASLAPELPSQELGWALITLESAKHVKLIWQQANKLAATYPNVDSSDMLSWGWLGLRTALRHYNPSLGFRFSTYACTRITGTIRDGVRSEKPIPKRLGTFARKVSAAEEMLTQQLGRTPTLEEVSEHLDADLAQLSLAHRAQPEASLDDIVQSAGSHGYTPHWLVAAADTSDAALAAMRNDAVEQALARLDPEEAHAVRLLVMEALHPTEARKATGATARQMRQRKERALRKLREELSDWA